jgi:hypothetical protein
MDADLIEKNWNKFESLCKRFEDPGLNSLLDTIGERLAMCPFSIKTESPGCYPGGLIDMSLRISASMRKINDTLDESDRLPTAKILKVGLLHEIGKVGDLEHDHFLEQDSSWHREKLGQMYKYNENLPKMSYPHRTLYMLQQSSVVLDRDMWEAILLSSGMHLEENRFYAGTRSHLSRILLSARMMTL